MRTAIIILVMLLFTVIIGQAIFFYSTRFVVVTLVQGEENLQESTKFFNAKIVGAHDNILVVRNIGYGLMDTKKLEIFVNDKQTQCDWNIRLVGSFNTTTCTLSARCSKDDPVVIKQNNIDQDASICT